MQNARGLPLIELFRLKSSPTLSSKSKLCAANQKHNPTLPGQNLPHNTTAVSESDTKSLKCIFNYSLSNFQLCLEQQLNPNSDRCLCVTCEK